MNKLKLPYFRKYTDSIFYKVKGRNEVIQVEIFDQSTAIKTGNLYGTFHPDSIECSESEFNEAFKKALSIIEKLID
jgi:hypothetical protein